MAKKKKTQPKDDLIEQLLDDVHDIAEDLSLADRFEGQDPTIQGASVFQHGLKDNSPVGLEPSAFEVPGYEESGPFQGPEASEDPLNIPSFESAEGHENEATRALGPGEAPAAGSGSEGASEPAAKASPFVRGGTATMNSEPTVAANGFVPRKAPQNEPQEKVVIGAHRGSRSGNVLTGMDASLAQAENLKLAQQKILELERENDRLRQENDEVSSAADIIRVRLEETMARLTASDREKADQQESAQNEIMILKGNLQFKDSEVAKARLKIDELDSRLKNDFKKIRVKERELENRLELVRAEKAALIRAKDENILELKRKIDQLQSEIDNYREKFLELNQTLGSQQEQFKRTVRALRLALANLEAKDENIVPLKKAE